MSTRRRLLRGLAGVATAGIAGCSTVTGGGTDPVTLLGAGSLTTALEQGLRPRLETPVRVGTRGSAAIARLVASGTRSPNIVSLADPALFDAPLSPPWHVTYATNAMVIAYNPDTVGGQALATHRTAWWEPVLSGVTRFGRTDPDLDPLGYRTLFTLDLAADYYPATPDLRAVLPEHTHVYPETQLLTQFETGALDGAFTYRNMAEERGYAYIELPSQIDLSTPRYRDRYHETAYTLPGGHTVDGDVIRYAATILEGADRPQVRTVFDRHTTGAYLDAYGFDRPDDYPRYIGDVPRHLTT